MMKIENPTRFVREMKGAPLSVIVLLTLARVAMTNEMLCAGTGYSDKTISGAVGYLEEIGLVTRSAGGWVISEGEQLALPMEDGGRETEDRRSIEDGDNSDKDCGSRKISDSDPIDSIVVNDSNINDLTTTKLSSEDESEKFRVAENMAVMAGEGIRETKQTRAIARLGHVDALYILAHCEQVRREKQKLGLAIWRMENGVKRSLGRRENGHFEGCGCNQCKYTDVGRVMTEAEEWEWWEENTGNSMDNLLNYPR